MDECAGCAKRRKEMAIMLEAGKAWAKAPLGPNLHTIYAKLLNEAITRGDFTDGPIRPNS